MSLSPSVTPLQPPVPKLVPVLLMNLKMASEPRPVYTNKQTHTALVVATVGQGEVSSLPNDYGYELSVSDITGFDDLTTNLETDVTTLDCKLYGKTPEGKGVYITYPGVSQLKGALTDVVAKKASTSSFSDTYLTNNPKFEFDGDIPDKYKWVRKENLIGKGRFVRDTDGVLYVQYYVYVIRG